MSEKAALSPSDEAAFWTLTPWPPLTRGAVSAADWGRDCSVFSGNIWNFQTIFSPSGPSGHLLNYGMIATGNHGYLRFPAGRTTLIRGRLAFPLSQRPPWPLRRGSFWMPTPRPPLTRGLSAQLTGGEHPGSVFPQRKKIMQQNLSLRQKSSFLPLTRGRGKKMFS